MDGRSWLWRRKSSEKSPRETESSGGSVSSHSERFSDDQIYLNQSSQSPEVTSKTKLPLEEFEGDVKTLSEKLSAALVNVSIKEDLVKQHSEVAEEAVEGWEKAESEVFALKQKIEVLTLKNSTLEDRVCHLDGALKECLKQLRQTKEEFENQLQSAKKTEMSSTYIEMAKKENSALKLELASMAEELEMRFIEMELSNQAAEQASKLHLESVKKATKFEAKCRRLNAALQKALVELGSYKTTPAMKINLMDDFLEIERVETEKTKLENELKMSRNQLKLAESKLVEMEDLISANDSREMAEIELESTKEIVKSLQESVKRLELEVVELKSQLEIVGNERRESESRIKGLESELESWELVVEKERAFSGKMGAKCQELEVEISRLQCENQNPETAIRNVEIRVKQDTKLALAAGKFADCQKTITSLSRQLKTLETLEEFLD